MYLNLYYTAFLREIQAPKSLRRIKQDEHKILDTDSLSILILLEYRYAIFI